MKFRAAVLVGTLGLALGAATAFVSPAAGGASHSHLYTHGESGNCTTHVDPINDVFVNVGYFNNADNHAGHHGGWGNNGGSTQKFAAHVCLAMDAQAASNAGVDPGGRYHMRFGQGWFAPGQFDYDQSSNNWLLWTTADAHHEDSVTCGFNPFAHAIDDNMNEPTGGFNRGRDDVWKNWTNNGAGGGFPHRYRGAQYWGNTMHMTQCNGNVAWSDGVVDFIEILSYSGH